MPISFQINPFYTTIHYYVKGMLTMKTPLLQKVLLVILDGFGNNPSNPYNAISQANTPHYDQLLNTCPYAELGASGKAVGLPANQMGNSEVGHLTIGAGRPIYMGLSRINQAIADGSFYHNTILLQAINDCKNQHNLHLMGLVSSGGVHSHIEHFKALLTLCQQQGCHQVYIHAFLDGRDTPPKSAQAELKELEDFCQDLGLGTIASICGRYYAMDRDKRWNRTAATYDLMVNGSAPYSATSATEGLLKAYDRGETDEFIQPTTIYTTEPLTIAPNDHVISLNFRADRIRQITQALIWPSMITSNPSNNIASDLRITTLTHYSDELSSEATVQIAFPPRKINDTLGEILAQNQKDQLRIAETEKYAHVTYFFNGGQEAVFDREQRSLIPSPSVSTYDQQPKMSASAITDELVDAIEHQRYSCIIANYANADMVGHTGDFPATITAIEHLDECLGRLMAACQTHQYALLITADHGNAEKMYDPQTNQAHTAHTNNQVPFIYQGQNSYQLARSQGTLSDIAPTVLYLLGLAKPDSMLGSSLLTHQDQ